MRGRPPFILAQVEGSGGPWTPDNLVVFISLALLGQWVHSLLVAAAAGDTQGTRTAALAYATKRAMVGSPTLLACVNKQFAKSVCAATGHLSTSALGQEIMATYIKASKSRLNKV